MTRMDRTLRGIGRIQKSFGTTDPTTIKAIDVMVTELHSTGKWDLLQAIKDGKLTLMEVYVAWKDQNLKSLTVSGVLPFDPTVFDWLKSYNDIKDRTKVDYERNYKLLLKVKSSFTLDEIPAVLKDYRRVCEKNKTGRQFNVVRNSLRAFLKNYFDPFNPIYQGVVMVKPLDEKPTRKETAWSVQEVQAVVKKMTPETGAQFWTMCLTGAGPTEYENGIVKEGDGIRVKGDKMARIDDRRNRLVPYVENPAPLVVKIKRFRGHLKKASDDKMLPYDARRSFAHWCLEATIPFDRIQQYMGHAPKTMTARYAQTQLAQWLKDDGKLLKDYIEAEKAKKTTTNKAFTQFFTIAKP